MIRVHTASRLHLGLLSVATSAASFGRRFGGVGLMVDRPGIELSIEPSHAWRAEGPLAERALGFARRYCESTGLQQAFHLTITSAAPEHAGLGTGTQLGLAVARAVAHWRGAEDVQASQLAPHVGRGLRSSLGIHGFQHGGFLVEGGKSADENLIAPLLCRHDFPDDWYILLATVPGVPSTHGRREVDAFADLAKQAANERVTESLCRLVLLGMLPALAERDLRIFGEAVYDFNRRVGAMFQSVQGGIYAHPQTAAFVQAAREAGVTGVGQSSWGPTAFAIVPAQQTSELHSRLARQVGVDPGTLLVTTACNHGAIVWP